MAAFKKNRPVSWIVTYENGSMGMLFTQHDHRGVAWHHGGRLLVQAHHMPTPKSRPSCTSKLVIIAQCNYLVSDLVSGQRQMWRGYDG